jgi:hypothetical protein|tara:strand:+ start:310 stop:1038 length:729 start_codon:yes stop_codon:yes gene_type:complete
MYTAHQAVTNPVTQQGIVVLNARKDSYSIATRNREGAHADENFHVLQHELAFTHEVQFRADVGEESVGIITSSNGMDKSSIDAFLLEARFVGIAATRALHDSYNSVSNEEDCTVQIGGMCTVLNNGQQPVTMNDWVMWDTVLFVGPGEQDFGGEQVYGAPKTKEQFTVLSANWLSSNYERLRHEAGEPAALHGLGANAIGMIKEKQGYGGMAHVQSNVIFGRAMNNAQPGAQLDILLGSHNL